MAATKKSYVVVRADSGVYCGLLVSKKPQGESHMVVELESVRHIWRWFGFSADKPVHTCEDIAVRGVAPTSKVSAAAPSATISDARAVFVCNVESRKVLEAVEWSAK